MLLTFAAHLAMLVHFAFVAFVLTGGVLGLKWRPLLVLHLPVFTYAVIIEAVRFPCPLTQIEKDLRFLANLPNYPGGFLGHYVEPHLSAVGVPPIVYQNMGYWTVAFNAALYAYLIYRWRKATAAPAQGAPPTTSSDTAAKVKSEA